MALVGSEPNILSWPPEIWRRTFSAAKPAVVTVEGFPTYPCNSSSQSRDLRAYRQYLQLKSVCSSFRIIFATCPELMTDLVFCPNFTDVEEFDMERMEEIDMEGVYHRYQNLTQWLKANSQITTMSAYLPLYMGNTKSPYEDPLFQALDQCQIKLESVSIFAPSWHISRVLACANVTTCHISRPAGQGSRMEVDHIVAMCNLQHLALQDGLYCSLTLPSSLTTLRIIDAKLSRRGMAYSCGPSDWSQADKLQELTICKAQVECMHEHGLCACSNLQKLELRYARFTAAAKVDSFVYGQGFPQAMSIASALTSLCVSLQEHSTFCQDVQCISSLCRLDLMCEGTELSAALENLTNLTELKIQALSIFDNEKGRRVIPPVKTGFDWGRLRMLQSIVVTGPAILGATVTSVIALPHLKYFGLHKFSSGDSVTEQAVNGIEALARSHSPQVLVEIQEGMSDAERLEVLYEFDDM